MSVSKAFRRVTESKFHGQKEEEVEKKQAVGPELYVTSRRICRTLVAISVDGESRRPSFRRC
jgi:hypothetical protein